MTSNDHIRRLVDSVIACLTPDVAQRILDLPIDPLLPKRLDELATKRTTTPHEDRAEEALLLLAVDMFNLLQARARAFLESRQRVAPR